MLVISTRWNFAFQLMSAKAHVDLKPESMNAIGIAHGGVSFTVEVDVFDENHTLTNKGTFNYFCITKKDS